MVDGQSRQRRGDGGVIDGEGRGRRGDGGVADGQSSGFPCSYIVFHRSKSPLTPSQEQPTNSTTVATH